MAEQKEKKQKKSSAYAKHKPCPKCGTGVRLAEHANRVSCGRCGYTEMKSGA